MYFFLEVVRKLFVTEECYDFFNFTPNLFKGKLFLSLVNFEIVNGALANVCYNCIMIECHYFYHIFQIEPVHEKTNNLRFRLGLTQTRLYSHRRQLEA